MLPANALASACMGRTGPVSLSGSTALDFGCGIARRIGELPSGIGRQPPWIPAPQPEAAYSPSANAPDSLRRLAFLLRGCIHKARIPALPPLSRPRI